VVAAQVTRMAMTFTNASEPGNPIIFANDSFLALTGFACEEVVGQSFHFLMARVADPDSVARIEAQFDEEDTETIEVECRRSDGQSVLVAIRINPVHDKDGKVVQHCISFVDLSAHVERVRQERDALHALYQHTPDFIATTHGAGHCFTFANDAFRRLVGSRGVLGQRVADALPELATQGFTAVLNDVFASGKSFAGKSMAVDLRRGSGASGETRFIDFICQAIRGPEGDITGIFCEGHDVTEQKQAAEQVHRLQADVIHLARVSAMGTMAATLAHELSQPLSAVSNYAELCSQVADSDDPDRAQLAEGLKGIRESAGRAREIVLRLKSMTKRKKPERERFDLKDSVAETLEIMRIGVCRTVTLSDRNTSAGVVVEADRVQIQQVMINLLRNGCEATFGRTNRRVTISTSVAEGFAIVSVQDNGPGVEPDSVASLFDWSDSTKPDGMGIGLSICRTIVSAHGGEIWLVKSPRRGACFRFSLPLPL
jgi:two-component system sensor kinase FixL